MTVIKRGKKDSHKDLINALGEFMDLLESQKEDEAIADLKIAKDEIMAATVGSDGYKKSIAKIIEARLDDGAGDTGRIQSVVIDGAEDMAQGASGSAAYDDSERYNMAFRL